jgi:hypothetical protein
MKYLLRKCEIRCGVLRQILFHIERERDISLKNREETAVELKNRCGTLRRVLIASINTTKKSLDTKSI